ncbi:MAG TPA: alpha/beta hydrolase [Candidatus Binatia bacterium]|jgi:acetyl esterase/lipase
MLHSPRRIALVIASGIGFFIIVANWENAKPTQASAAQSTPKANLIRDIAYTKPADPKNARRQTLDLYLPEMSVRKPPLLVFVHGGFWTLSDDEYQIGPAVAEALLPNGVAVALVRYRLAPAHTHPVPAQDVAAAIAHLIRSADKFGYDAKRVYLAGHSAGAHLAALVALDGSYLGAQRLTPRSLAGVVGFSGIYDLRPRPESAEQQKLAVRQAFGDNPDKLATASPTTHARAEAPPFLILGAENDFPGFLIDAKRFAESLRKTGHKQAEQFILPDHDHFSLVQLIDRDAELRSLLLEFFKAQPLPREIAVLIEAKRRWLNPPLSTAPFWREKKLIRSYPVDRRFVEELVLLYSGMKYELLEWPLETYHAIDLFAYLDSLPPEKIGRGKYLTVTNFRNEKLFFDRHQIEPYKPVIVVGLDDEKNLFRLGVFYQALREYSWRGGAKPPMMARPLGAFIRFLEEPPPELIRQAPYYGLTENSFQLVEDDPLASLKDLPKQVYEAVTVRNGCVYCHSFHGVGPQSHHVTAANNKPHGGLALALESYPENVWKEFMFNQEAAAKKIGASPNIVAEDARQALYDLVVESRKKQNAVGQ